MTVDAAMWTLKLPLRFWEDHYDRCSDQPGTREVMRRTKREAMVKLDREALDNLLSDADFYASCPNANVGEFLTARELKLSAAATLRRLAAAGLLGN